MVSTICYKNVSIPLEGYSIRTSKFALLSPPFDRRILSNFRYCQRKERVRGRKRGGPSPPRFRPLALSFAPLSRSLEQANRQLPRGLSHPCHSLPPLKDAEIFQRLNLLLKKLKQVCTPKFRKTRFLHL